MFSFTPGITAIVEGLKSVPREVLVWPSHEKCSAGRSPHVIISSADRTQAVTVPMGVELILKKRKLLQKQQRNSNPNICISNAASNDCMG